MGRQGVSPSQRAPARCLPVGAPISGLAEVAR